MTFFLVGIIGTILGAAPAQALDVDFFPMLHPDASQPPGTEYFELAMKSQHAMLLYLRENPGLPVFVESLYESVEQPIPQFLNEIGEEVRGVFEGEQFPQFYEDFSDTQKRVLFAAGIGSNVMYLLGQVPSLLATCTIQEHFVALKNGFNPHAGRLHEIARGALAPKDEAEKIEAQTFMYEVMDLREMATLNTVRRFALAHPEVKRVALMYGNGHNFNRYEKDYPELKIRPVNVRRYTRRRNDVFQNALMSAADREVLQMGYNPFIYNPQTERFEMRVGL